MKRSLLLSLVVLLAVLAIVGYALPGLSGNIVSAAAQPAGVAAAPVHASVPQFSTVTDLQSAFENIYNQVNPSVVTINVITTGGSNAPSNGFGGQGPAQQALGSGFVWDNQGDIVTNNHVIDGATQISVMFADGTTVVGKVVGADPDSDLAVVKVNAPANELHPVQVGDSTALKVGQLAIAIGNPFGEQNTMTTGIISAIGRNLPVNAGATAQGPSFTIPDVIQTDAPINPGNSGGVLLNTDGQVIGVTFQIESQSGTSSGVGFAIPASIVQKVVPALISTGHYSHSYLGISGTTLTSDLAQAMNLPATQRGALVGDVTQNGPAAKAGIKGSTQQAPNGVQANVGGDVIIAINGQAVKTFDDIVSYLANSTQVGQTVTLTVLRNGQQQNIQVTLTARPGGA